MEARTRQRISLSFFFFLSGFAFATWASRIPTIKDMFELNEAQLGNLLLALPLSSLAGLPISGWLVSRFDSRFPLIASFLMFSIALALIGFASNIWLLVGAIFLFSFNMRILNISMNTQSITLQNAYTKKIIGSFHGLWSTGGLTGVGMSTLFIKYDVGIQIHLLVISILGLICGVGAFRFLLKKDRSSKGNKLRLGKPDKFILYLGLILFFAAICEGGMFDWSGVYFRDVVNEEIFTLGYFVFMAFMALSRFFSDKIVEKIGMKKMYIISSSLVSLGILLMIIFPYFWPALLGFSLVGVGVAAVVPMTFSLAGTSKKYSAGMAVSIIATYGIVGMLLGPVLIGYLAHLLNLRVSFILFIIAGLMFIPMSRLFFQLKEEDEK